MRLLLTSMCVAAVTLGTCVSHPAFGSSSGSESSGASAEWEQFFQEDGITVWRREVPGSSFVAFRGRGNVEAPAVQIAATIRHADRQPEWMHRCADAGVIAYKTATSAIIYNRTASPAFFIADRDTVLVNEMSIDKATKTLTVQFYNTEHKLVPPKDGVVRMPRLNGHWKLRQIDVDTTEVEYQVEADPGGALPAWLVNMVSKTLPYDTLKGLRQQVRRGGYDKDRTILLVSLDWEGFELPPFGPSVGTRTATAARP